MPNDISITPIPKELTILIELMLSHPSVKLDQFFTIFSFPFHFFLFFLFFPIFVLSFFFLFFSTSIHYMHVPIGFPKQSHILLLIVFPNMKFASDSSVGFHHGTTSTDMH